MHVLETTPEQHDLGLEIVRDQLLPWLRDSSGFRGLIRMASRAEGKTLVITLWVDEESLQASARAGNKLGELTAETTGVTRLALEDYEVNTLRCRRLLDFVLGESFARILTETTQSLVCVLDRDGRILLFNDACERATGFRATRSSAATRATS